MVWKKKLLFETFRHWCSLQLATAGKKSVALDEFAGERAIGRGADAAGVVLEDRFAEARRLAQAHRPRNHRTINALAKMLPYFVDDLFAKICSTVEHRH